MNKMMAYCGLLCSECPAYIATVNNDAVLREKTAAEWSKNFKADIKADDINCLGCKSQGTVFSHCNICEIRACSKDNQLNNCAECVNYGCGKLETVLQYVPEARERLEKLKGQN